MMAAVERVAGHKKVAYKGEDWIFERMGRWGQ